MSALTRVGSATNNADSTTVSCTHGITITSGDLVLAIVHADGAQTVSDNNGSYPFTQKTSYNYTSATRAVWHRIAGASEPAAYSFNISAFNKVSLMVIVYRPAAGESIAADPFDVAPAATLTDSGGSAVTTIEAPAITINGDNVTALAVGYIDSGLATWSTYPGDSYSHIRDAADHQFAVSDKAVNSGTQAAVSWTWVTSLKAAAEQFALKASVGSGTSITKNINEIENLYEVINKIPGYPKYVQEIEQLSEMINRRETLRRWSSELVNIREVIQYRLILTRWISEPVNIYETVNYRKTMYRFISELINIYEATTKTAGFAKVVSELLNIYEATTKTAGFVKIVSEIVNIYESVSQNKVLRRVVSELLNVYEVVSRNFVYRRSINEIVGIDEVVNRRSILTRIVSEAVSILEAIGRNLGVPAVLTKFVNELVGLTEGVPRVKRPVGHLIAIILSSVKGIYVAIRDRKAINDK